MDVDKLLRNLLATGKANPQKPIIDAIDALNPFNNKIGDLDRVVNLFASSSRDRDIASTKSLEYLNMFWILADKKNADLDIIKYIFEEVIKHSNRTELPTVLENIAEYLIINRMEEWLQRLIKNELFVNNKIDLKNNKEYRFEAVMIDRILWKEEDVKQLKITLKKIETEENKNDIKSIREGLLFGEFVRDNKFIDVFYEDKKERETIFNKFIASFDMGQVVVSHTVYTLVGKRSEIFDIMKAGFNLGIKNKEFNIFINKTITGLISPNYDQYMILKIAEDIIKIINEKKYLKINKDTQENLVLFIENFKKKRKGASGGGVGGILQKIVDAGVIPDPDLTIIGELEKVIIGLANQNKKKAKRKLSKI